MALAEGIPRAGDRLTAEDGTLLEVLEATPRRVTSLRVVPPPAGASPAPRHPPPEPE
jgi:CBS domain containing-hemolysin-like protein